MGIPEMRRRGYPDDVATGSICAGGTLGILIPPSITFILYGIATETSIGRLFIAGVMPGLMLTALFMLWTVLSTLEGWVPFPRALLPLSAGRENSSRSRRSRRSGHHFRGHVLLYGGVATPVGSGGVGAALCMFLAILILPALENPSRSG
jgi:TRAP-type C4-dicarboxylate transport system permease large subunit